MSYRSRRRRDEPGQALAACVAALDRLDALRRAGGGPASRDYQAEFTRFVALRSELTPEDRAAADEHSQALWSAYTAFLEAEEETARRERARRPQAAKVRREETVGHRRQPEPTAALPGSEAKLRELARRRRRGAELHGPEDADDDPRRGLKTLPKRNGSAGEWDKGLDIVPLDGKQKLSPPVMRYGFPARLREARLRRGWGQLILSRKSGLTQAFLSLLESGKRRPSIEAVRALAEALGVSADHLLAVKSTTPPSGR